MSQPSVAPACCSKQSVPLIMENTETPRYRYEPISLNSIRLLEVNTRGDSEAPVTGSLLTRDLNDIHPEYTTLSYSWGRNSDGDASLSHSILIDGHEIPITENLYDFLLQISEPGSGFRQLLWIDAICINQTDVKERSEQVSIMAEIYQKASTLIIWLGCSLDQMEDKQAMEALQSLRMKTEIDSLSSKISPLRDSCPILNDIFRSQARGPLSEGLTTVINHCPRGHHGRPDLYQSPFWPEVISLALSGPYRSRSCMHSYADPTHEELISQYHHIYRSLTNCESDLSHDLRTFFVSLLAKTSSLCGRRYFSRRRIVQEICQSALDRTTVRWHPFSIDADEFCGKLRMILGCLRVCQGIVDSQRGVITVDDNLVMLENCRKALDIFDFRPLKESDSAEIGAERLLESLHRFEHTRCADDRDLVYAFLGLVNFRTQLVANYHISANEAFAALATILVKDGSLGGTLIAASYQWQHEIRHKSLE